MKSLESHAINFAVDFKNGDVVHFEFEGGIWKAELQDGEILEAKTV